MERRIDVGIFMVVLDVIFTMYFGYGYYRGSFMDFFTTAERTICSNYP